VVAVVSVDRRSLFVICGAAVLLTAAWRMTPPTAPPLYDGLPLTVDPYRYVSPPPGLQHPKPDTFSQTLVTDSGKSPAIAEATDESPAQAQLLAQGDSFALPQGVTMVTVTIAPVDAPAQKPSAGFIDGNVYSFSVSAGSTPLPMKPGAEATVVLRGPPGATGVDVEQFSGTSWAKLTTTPVGAPDTYAANVTVLGDIALVATGEAPSTQASSGGSGAGGDGGGSNAAVIAAIAAGGVIVIVAAAIAGIRARATRGSPPRRAGAPRPPTARGRERPSSPRRKPPRRR
jgi:hypothetical protein